MEWRENIAWGKEEEERRRGGDEGLIWPSRPGKKGQVTPTTAQTRAQLCRVSNCSRPSSLMAYIAVARLLPGCELR